MCTIGIVYRSHPELSLVIAANRDEMLSRASSAPTVVQGSGPRIVAGVDQTSGGTWMGVNDAGMFVGLTNQKSFDGPDPTLDSRGPVVLDLLRATSMEDVRSRVSALDPQRYNEFNLIYSDGRDLEVAYARRDATALRRVDVKPGVHVLPVSELNDDSFEKVTAFRAELGQLKQLDNARELGSLLADHKKPNRVADTPAPEPFRPRAASGIGSVVHSYSPLRYKIGHHRHAR